MPRALLAILLLALAACAAGPGKQPTMTDMDVVARDQRFALVRLKAGQTREQVAAVFLGDASQTWQLREANAANTSTAGSILAVPLQVVNSSSVYPDGYRTLPILCYHQFTDADRASHRLELTAEAFEQQLRYLLDNHYQLLSFAEVESILDAGGPLPERGVVLSIDDGYGSVYDVAWPILQKYQARATLFIYTDFIGAGDALSWKQMQEMAASGLIEIQSHAKSHTSLSRAPQDSSKSGYSSRVQQEITGSGAAFRRHLGYTPRYLSYPYGNTSATTVEVVAAQNYGLAATVTRGNNTVFSDPYLLHRTMIYDDHDMEDFRRIVHGYRRKSLQ